MSAIKSYATVTAAYWGFTLTDGALRMLVVLYFHQLGYAALDIAFLFLFYEFFGIVTNLFGGWLAARFGLNKTLFSGLILQILALYLLSLENYLSVPYVMAAQAISGIAKDLNKMSAKSSLKLLVPEDTQGQLFKWVAILTGSKNTLKGVGFFLGGLLLSWLGYQAALLSMAGGLVAIFIVCALLLPADLAPQKYKVKIKHLFSKSESINRLSAARFFLFGARDIWFVVALPVFLQASLLWTHAEVGILMAVWVILYGLVQSSTPRALGFKKPEHAPDGQTAAKAVGILLIAPVLMIIAAKLGVDMTVVIIGGLLSFAVIFAVNSAIHSYLVLAYSTKDDVSLDVGFYYMSNAAGRLVGTLLSGLIYQWCGFIACITGSAIMIGACALISLKLKSLEKG
ncbi:organoarsenical effux MFS transporter ArsJ [Aliikangiella coralliicola]|uniref:Organoarsenical effux MFS transporter ArsJ n=1 Tax=Aliikangiella coralliicola TaxID=2592383 RepID=A0A545UI70_9GAMM|nr:organoarsenical effux MFS transporter ArsJ [Aliikangiella coralliicola]TQV89133.1 organoarsenical effux MFS transporter ArsJ [Aliikangiella coralliicola]